MRALAETLALPSGVLEQAAGRGKVDHSTAGAQTIWRRLKEQGQQASIVGEILALCVASHHGGLIDCITPSSKDGFSRRMDTVDENSHYYEEAWSKADASLKEWTTCCFMAFPSSACRGPHGPRGLKHPYLA